MISSIPRKNETQYNYHIVMPLPLFDLYQLYPIVHYPIIHILGREEHNPCLCMGKVKFLLTIRLCIFLMHAMVMMCEAEKFVCV